MKSIAGISRPDSNNGSTVTLEGFDANYDLANALNSFYSRFDTAEFSREIQEISHKLIDQDHFNIREEDIVRAFTLIKTRARDQMKFVSAY